MTGQEAGDFVDSDRKTIQDAANAFSKVSDVSHGHGQMGIINKTDIVGAS